GRKSQRISRSKRRVTSSSISVVALQKVPERS
ncbi:hypothetical protein GCK32_021073, partial [Trichostrongylus colubriformis]